MTAEQLRALQTPLKVRYREDPATARATLRSTGTLIPGSLTCKVETWAGTAEAAGTHADDGQDVPGLIVAVNKVDRASQAQVLERLTGAKEAVDALAVVRMHPAQQNFVGSLHRG